MIVMTQCRADQYAGGARLAEYLFEGLTSPYADTDGNGYVSVEEGFDYAKAKIGSEWKIKDNNNESCEAQISDPYNISSEIYLGVYPVERNP